MNQGKFISRRKLASLVMWGFLGLFALAYVLQSEIPIYGVFPLFVFYFITTRTNLFGQRVRKQDDGSYRDES